MNAKKKIVMAVTGMLLIPCSSVAGAEMEGLPMMELNAKIVSQGDFKVKGLVQDGFGPITGASVYVKGHPEKGVTTDMEGQFTLLCRPTDILVISFIGYQTQEITLKKGQEVLSITLKEDAKTLDEVVVTAFGSGQKKETLIGSVQQVQPQGLRVPSAGISSSFAGRLSGVIAVQRSGQPGSNGAEFYIRGISTINGTRSPLIVLDGMEISSGDLEHLDPDVIESFSLLKDASATAMYGTRGANGVMIITTKSGADLDKPVIGFRFEANVTSPVKVPEFVDGPRFMELYNEAIKNQGSGLKLYSSEDIEATRNNVNPYVFPNVDWYGEMFKDMAFNQKANFNIRGGTKKIVYFMNLNIDRQTGMLKDVAKDYGFSYNTNISQTRYTFQNNIDFHMSKSSTISLHLYTALDDYEGPIDSTGDIYYQLTGTSPVAYPITYPSDDEWIHWGYKNMGVIGQSGGGFDNPIARMTRGYKSSFESVVNANLSFKQKLDFITEGLSFNAMISFKNWSKSHAERSQGWNMYELNSYQKDKDGSYTFTTSPVVDPVKPTLGTSGWTEGDRRMYMQAYFDYNRTFGDHTVSGMLLWNADEYNTNMVSDLVSSLPQRKMGFAGRLSYDYQRRYIVEFNAGYNGSENFAAGHRWGFFPSVGAGIVLSEEKFWEPLKNAISHFKVRASYGLVGNDDTGAGRFIYRESVGLTNTNWFQTGYSNTQGASGPVWWRVRNEDISWEVGHKLNIGADLQLFHDLNITFDWFKEKRTNLFQEKMSIPAYLGTQNVKIFGNFAEMKNSGFDFSMDYNKRFSKDFGIQFKGTFTYAHNEITKYDEAPGQRSALKQVGSHVNRILGYVADGLYVDVDDVAKGPKSTINTLPVSLGDIKYIDQPDANGVYDNAITSDDQVVLGYPTVPEITYGFGPSIQWKNWDISCFFQGVARVSFTINNGTYGGIAPFGDKFSRNVLKFIDENHWSPENPDIHAAYPRLTISRNVQNEVTSSYWLRNGAFLKLKNAEIGYSFKKCRIYVSGANLLTFAPFKLWDPEMGGGGGMQYPTQRTFNIGIQLTIN